MLLHNFAHNIKTVRVMNAVAAGTTDQATSWVDTIGAHAVCFTALFGTLTATQVTSALLEYSADGSTDAGDVAGSATSALADTDSNKMIQIDLYRPKYRYVRMTIDRGTANAVIDGVIAQVYNFERVPITKDTSVALTPEVLNSPSTGTA